MFARLVVGTEDDLFNRYAQARNIKEEQDRFCNNILNDNWQFVSSHFPEELKWEALVDVLRGRVKVIESIFGYILLICKPGQYALLRICGSR